MTSSCAISVVIPTYQRGPSVLRVLKALGDQTCGPDQYEVIVSVDGPDDATTGMISQLAVPYRLIVTSHPRGGRAAACNAGVKLAQGELLIFLDDDMEPVPEFLTAHQQAHGPTSRLGVLGGVPITVEASSPPVVKYIGEKFNRHLEHLAQPGYQFQLTHFYSGNFSMRRELFLQLNAFDDAFKMYGNEDLDLFVRLRMAGVQLKYCSHAKARQYYTKDFYALARDNIAKGRTAVLLATKHPQTFQELKLATYHQGSRVWRLLRWALLGLSSMWDGTPNRVIAFMMWLERREPVHLHLGYRLVLDYCYWVGARSALRETVGSNELPLFRPKKSLPS